MSQLRQQEKRLAELDVCVMVVTFDANFMALAYVDETHLPWPLLEDPEQTLYEAYGMTKGSWWTIYGLPTLWKYIKMIFRGRMPGRPGKDWRQLGGDVLINPQGIVRIQYVSEGPHDRPTIESLMAPIEN